MTATLDLYRLLQQPADQVRKVCLHGAARREQEWEQEQEQEQEREREQKTVADPGDEDFVARMLGHLDLVIDPRDKSVADPIRQVGFWEWDLTKGVADIMRPGLTCVVSGIGAGRGHPG